MLNLDLPKIIARRYSAFSGEDLFVLQSGKRRTLGASYVNYSIYSDDPNDLFTERYWGISSQSVKQRKPEAQKALILGLGAGTLAYLLDHYYPGIETDGIEIDPTVIILGKQYFYLDKLPHLHLHELDALVWMRDNLATLKETYDIIFIDLFKLETTPSDCDTPAFFSDVSQFLKKGGIMSLNKIFHRKSGKEKVEEYLDTKIRPYFSNVENTRHKGAVELDNVIIYASK